MLFIASYLLLGAISGFIAGVFGLGGGIIIVPTLIFTFTYLDFPSEVLTHLAIGTSLTSIIFTSLSAIYVHHKRSAIDWSIAIRLSVGMFIGGLFGAYTADLLDGKNLQIIFACYAFFVSVQMWFSLTPKDRLQSYLRFCFQKSLVFKAFWKQFSVSYFVTMPKATFQLPQRFGCGLLGSVVGFTSGLFGIAGGSLIVPILTFYKVNMTRAVATASVTGFPIALSGALGYLWAGQNNSNLPEHAIGYVYWPALLGIVISSTYFAKVGAKLTHALNPKILKKSFSILMLLIALKLLF